MRLGLTSTLLRESDRGMAAVEQMIQYKPELLAGGYRHRSLGAA
jgi:hypothetical protein